MLDMHISCKLSFRNCFGAVPKYSINNSNDNEQVAAELQMFLKYFTSDVEAVIRRITSLLNITRPRI